MSPSKAQIILNVLQVYDILLYLIIGYISFVTSVEWCTPTLESDRLVFEPLPYLVLDVCFGIDILTSELPFPYL